MNYAIISDIHGCYKTLLKLLSEIPKDHKVIFAGDLVDRGPQSRRVIEFAIKNNIPCVLGNHDDMMVDWVLNEGRYESGVWKQNGGDKTLLNYRCGSSCRDTIKKHATWLKYLPLTIDLGDAIVSHTGHISHDRFVDLWYRGEPEWKGKFNIFGHTPHTPMKLNKYWACVDTGCAYPRHGNLSAFLWPSKGVITVANIE